MKWAILLGLLIGAALPASAMAANLAYVSGGSVWIAHADGTHARRLIHGVVSRVPRPTSSRTGTSM